MFFTKTRTVEGVSGLLNPVKAYRIAGAAVNSAITGAIPNFNGLAIQTPATALTSDFITGWVLSPGNVFSYSLDTATISSAASSATFTAGASNAISGYSAGGSPYGAGLTISFFNYNVFGAGTLTLSSGASNINCPYFSYLYRERVAAANPSRDGKLNHVAFCPFDQSVPLGSALASVVLSSPSFPSVFVQGQELSYFLQYAFSNSAGYLSAFALQTGSPGSTNACSLSSSSSIRPASAGRQQLSLVLVFGQLALGTLYSGYPSFKVALTLPSIGGTLAVLPGACPVENPLLDCSVAWASPTATVTFTYTGTVTTALSSLRFNIYLTSGSAFTGTGSLQAQVVLPQLVGTAFSLYGSAYSGTAVVFQSCGVALSTAPNSYQATFSAGPLALMSSTAGAVSTLRLQFKASSPRDNFYADSFVEINLGFLGAANQPAVGKGFRCAVRQLLSSGSYNASSLFKEIDYSSLTALKIYPKYEFSNPSSLTFSLSCINALVGSGTASLSAKWTDAGAVNYQTSAAVTAPTLLAAATSLSVSAFSKAYNNQGSEAFLTFELAVGSALSITARLYLQFSGAVPPRLNRDGYAECYMRASLTSAYTQSYCEFLADNILVLYNTVELAAAGTLVVDVLGVAVSPELTNSHTVQLTLDEDADLSNGVLGSASTSELAPGPVPTNTITITAVTSSTAFTKAQLILTVAFSVPGAASLISASNKLFLILPSEFAVWNTKGGTPVCSLATAAAPSANLASACTFLSKRLVQLTVSASSATDFVMTVSGIYSPVS